jgi:hypothetical protein
MIATLATRLGIPAARSAMRFLSKLKKPPSGGITVFRGEPKSTASIKDMAKWMYGPEAKYGLGPSPLRHGAAGRWFTEKPKFASRFAGYTGFGGRGVIKKVTLSPKEVRLAKKLSRKIHEGSGREGSSISMVIPKKALARVETDYLQTLINNFYKNLGIYRAKHGGLAGILEV